MRILIADDHALFRDSLKSLLEARNHSVVAEARNGREAIEMARRHKPEIVLMDLSMPEVDGLTATRLICAELPEVKVVVLTASDDDANLFEAVKSGAQGYLLKNLEAKDFFTLLEGVRRGEAALTPALARRLMSEFSRPKVSTADPDALTEREREVLQLLVEGVTSNRKLAGELDVSENTVKFHVRNILDKLHLNNRAQVVAFALRNRLIVPRDPTD